MPEFERVRPADHGRGDAVALPWAIVLSDWLPSRGEELVSRVKGVFPCEGCREPLPTVLVVDDVGGLQAAHQKVLTDLTEAGAVVLEPEGAEELALVQGDPLAFAARQLAVATQGVPAASSPSRPGQPSNPDAYRQFATPFTRLSPEELANMVEGRRPGDWRYEI